MTIVIVDGLKKSISMTISDIACDALFEAAMAVVKVFSYKRRLPTWVRGSLYESILRFLLASSNSAARVCTVCSMLSLCC
jgi:hypothetical protein